MLIYSDTFFEAIKQFALVNDEIVFNVLTSHFEGMFAKYINASFKPEGSMFLSAIHKFFR